jgi:hypothetical protein
MWRHERRKRKALETLPAWEITLVQAELAQGKQVAEKRLIERIEPYFSVSAKAVAITVGLSTLYLAWAPMHWYRPEPVRKYMEQKLEDASTTLHNEQASSVALVSRDSSITDQAAH